MVTAALPTSPGRPVLAFEGKRQWGSRRDIIGWSDGDRSPPVTVKATIDGEFKLLGTDDGIASPSTTPLLAGALASRSTDTSFPNHSNGEPLLDADASKYHDGPSEYERLVDEHLALEASAEEKELKDERRRESLRLISGLDDLDLMSMLRSFDKQVQNVRICPPPYDSVIPHGLDLHPSPEEELTIDKTRAHLERFYTSVLVKLLRLGKEISRISNWEEGGVRTVVALAFYVHAWIFDQIILWLLLFIGALILFPSFRRYAFDPPYQVPSSITYSQWGAAAHEKAASNWADSAVEVAKSIGSSGSNQPQTVKDLKTHVKGKMDEEVDTEDERQKRARSSKYGKGDENDDGDDRSRADKAKELFGQPLMRIVGGVGDKFERISNALSPTPAYSLESQRLKVFLYLIAPLIPASIFITERMASKAVGLIIGSALFAQPLLLNIYQEINERYPTWKQYLILENNILEDVPTNAQLVLRLLRDAEHHQNPLPPAPSDAEEIAAHLKTQEVLEGEDEDGEEDDGESEGGESSRMKKLEGKIGSMGSSMIGSARRRVRRALDKVGHAKEEGFALVTGHKNMDNTTKAGFGISSTNEAIKSGGKLHQQVPHLSESAALESSRYYVWHQKHGPGHLFIHPPSLPSPESRYSFTPARLTFTTIRKVPAEQQTLLRSEADAAKGDLTISINDVVGLKKENQSWPRRLITAGVTNAEGAGGSGLEIVFIRKDRAEVPFPRMGDGEEEKVIVGREQTVHFSGLVRRNELFDRLISVGEQKWEML